MKISYHSDLHLDSAHTLPELPGGEVLVLAGDITEYKYLVKISDTDFEQIRHLPAQKLTTKQRIYRFFVEQCSEKYKHVIYVAGNHEHYRGTFQKTLPKLKYNVPANFHVLEKDNVTIDGVLFLGATLWTDMNRGDPVTRQIVRYGMNDYTRIRRERNGDYIKLSPSDTEAEHFKTLQYFKTILDLPINEGKKVVVVSHHAPTGLSVAEQFKDQFCMNGGYHSRLDDFILDHPQIKYWFHGHTHDVFDYMVGDHTRVLCNPHGYGTRNFQEETGWNPHAVVEI